MYTDTVESYGYRDVVVVVPAACRFVVAGWPRRGCFVRLRLRPDTV